MLWKMNGRKDKKKYLVSAVLQKQKKGGVEGGNFQETVH